MTDQIDQITDTDVEEIETEGGTPNRRRMFLAGAGLAGAAAIVGKSGVAQAADGATYTGDVTTYQNNNTVDTDPGNPGNEAIVGEVLGADNGSHAIRGNTLGDGHAIAGTVTVDNDNNAVAATWGKHDNGLGAGVGGVNGATDVDIAGPARGVEGIVINDSNGSHAVFGLTNGGGHSVAGDTPADAGPDDAPNTVAATWGRHQGTGAGIGGISIGGYGGEFVGARASIRLIPASEVDAVDQLANDANSKMGELIVDSAGTLFYNNVDGDSDDGPNFTRLNNQVITYDEAGRAFDSREGATPVTANQGRFAAGETREIDLSGLVNPGSAANLNVTVADTGTIGFLTLFNGDTDDDSRPTTSAITWDRAGTRTTNGTSVRTSPRGTIKVYAESDTEVVIDITGYTD